MNSSVELLPVLGQTRQEKAQILYFTLTLIVGAPFNLYAFCTNLRKLRGASPRSSKAPTQTHSFPIRSPTVLLFQKPSKAPEMILLVLNLNISDLLILFVYLPTQIAWKSTIQWHGWCDSSLGLVGLRRLEFVQEERRCVDCCDSHTSSPFI